MDKRTILENLINYYTDGNKARFAAMIGVKPQTINTWISRNSFDVELLFAKCEGLNASWLLTGEGDMLTSSPVQVIGDPHVTASGTNAAATLVGNITTVAPSTRAARRTARRAATTIADPATTIADLRATVATLTADKSTLTATIADLRDTVAAQRDTISSQKEVIALLKNLPK